MNATLGDAYARAESLLPERLGGVTLAALSRDFHHCLVQRGLTARGTSMDFDAIIVGGSYAGISAALPMADARKRIAVINGARRRIRFAGHSYGFFGQVGEPPGEIAARAREQLLRCLMAYRQPSP